MPTIKDLFGNQEQSLKILSATDINQLTSSHDAESFGYIEATQEEDERFFPAVDYAKPKNFAKYGRAEKYYEDSIKRIYRMFPYDGSNKEKTEWHNASSYLDNYIFDNEYPRTTGYLIFSASQAAAGSTKVSSHNEAYHHLASPQFVIAKGGPHAAAVLEEDDKIKAQNPTIKSKSGQSAYTSPIANIYDADKRRSTNFAMGGAQGNTIECWTNIGTQVSRPGGVRRAYTSVLFDLWNGNRTDVTDSAYNPLTAIGSASYGRFLIEKRVGAGGPNNALPMTGNLHLTYMSGTSGVLRVPLFLTATMGNITSSAEWNHVAISVKNSGLSGDDDGLLVKSYLNGKLIDTIYTGSSVGEVTGTLNANIGAYRHYPLDTLKTYFVNPARDYTDFSGWGAISGSIDEFRFWKVARNSQQVGRNWFTQVYGGTNSDDANTTLGVYYKFNEGITQIASFDQLTVDYSGRISDGIIQNYTSDVRATGSAMVEAKAASSEYKDPILYSFHPEVSSLITAKKELGSVYDITNNASIINSFPDWIVDEDIEVGGGNLQNLVQIVAQYFDNLQVMMDYLNHLKDIEYTKYCEITAVPYSDGGSIFNSTSYDLGSYSHSASYSGKPLPFSKNLLSAVGLCVPEIFTDAVALETLSSRDDYRIFQQKIGDVKNQIYQNIYNNLNYIFKSKGTEKAFRNLIRCYGVDEELIKINLYGDNITHKIRNNFRSVAAKKTYIDFNHTDRFSATVYQMASSTPPYSANADRSYIPPNSTLSGGGYGFTVESEVLFPKKYPGSVDYQSYTSLTSSLFGMYTPNSPSTGDDADTTWASVQVSDFQAYAIKDVLESNAEYGGDTYFWLTSSALGVSLTSSLFNDVYDNNKWNFAVRVKPAKYPWANSVTGVSGISSNTKYEVSFYGVNADLDVISNEFSISASVSNLAGNLFFSGSKRLYLGAEKTNFTGSVLAQADIKASSTRVWLDYLTNDEMKAHARDAESRGVLHPYRNSFLFQDKSNPYYIPRSQLLMLDWDFSQVTSSGPDGRFEVQDVSSGSTEANYAPGISDDRYGPLRTVLRYQFAGRGDSFPANDGNTSQREYIYSAQQIPPEIIESYDMVNLLDRDDIGFTKESLPINYFIAVEKSMYQTISEEMLRMFATIRDFNNLIGDPVNRYRGRYKNMEKLKNLFYENIGNSPDLEKYVKFYKWIDSSITMFLEQLFPASANYSTEMRTLVESHVLERNAYRNKFPTLEMKQEDPESTILGINELTYNWKYGHAPIAQFTNIKSTAFNGVDAQSQLTVPDADSLSFGADGTTGNEPSFSWSAWIKPTDLDKPFGIVSKILTGGSGDEYFFGHIPFVGLLLLIADGDGFGGDYIAQTNVTLTEGVWQHVCCTYDGSRTPTGIKLYLNGAVATSVGLTPGSYTAMSNSGADLVIGRRWSGLTTNVSEGFIDEVAAFNKTLSAAEVTELYNSAKALNLKIFSAEPNLVSWWRMGDGVTGTSPNYTIPDQIGSNNAAMSAFQGDSTSGVVIDAVPANEANANDNCLWWNQRAERSVTPLSQSNSGVNADRDKILHVATTENSGSYLKRVQGSTYVLRKLSRPYKEGVVFGKQLHGGINYAQTKNREFYRSKINEIGADNTLSFAKAGMATDPERDCNDNNGLKFKQKLKFEIKPSDDAATYKGNLVSPFNLYHSKPPATSPLIESIADEVEFVNLHSDTYGISNEIPMQTPFTEKYVGGNQYRHVGLNISPLTTPATRPEGFVIDQANTRIQGPDYGDLSRPRATRTREPLAKRPVNIKNIQQKTGSTIIGNYNKNYNFIQTSGRKINNKYFVEATGSGFGYNVRATLINTSEISAYFNTYWNFPLPNRSVHDTIFVERFSAPGSFEVLSLGYLDPFAEEYSAYNALPWRNWSVRGPRYKKPGNRSNTVNMSASIWSTASLSLQSLLTRHCGWGGYDGELQTSGAYQKTNRNSLRTMQFDGASLTSYSTGSQFDNWWVQHPIPRSDFNYAWITASVISTDPSNAFGFGYFPADGMVSSSAGGFESAVNFVSASGQGSWFLVSRWYGSQPESYGQARQFIPNDFVGLNSNIYDPLTSSDNNLGYPLTAFVGLNPGVAQSKYAYKGGLIDYAHANFEGLTMVLNGLLLHRNGPYQYPSWKQIRAGETPVPRYHKKNNIFSISVRNISSLNKFIVFPRLGGMSGRTAAESSYKKLEGVTHKMQNVAAVSIENYTEPLITSKYFPMRHTLDTVNEKMLSELVIDHTYANNMATFANPQLETKIVQAGVLKKAPEQMYDKLIGLYIKGTLPAESNPIKGFKNLVYKETVYPKAQNTYLGKTRGRTKYTETATTIQGTSYTKPLGDQRTFWKENRADRLRTGGIARNALNYKIESSDILGPGLYNTATSPALRPTGLSVWPLDVGTRYVANTKLPPYSKLSGSNHGQLSINASTASLFTATASFAYEYHNDIWARMPITGTLFSASVAQDSHFMTDFIPDWETTKLAGKDPWFDSYEDYAQDIRCFGKEYTVLPEFRISDHMDYYLKEQNFQAKNNKFLSLEGGALSQSAPTEISPFDSGFFNEYSHSDFLKHFELIQEEHKGIALATQLTFKCHGIKKLLPYNGFYPTTRTVQLANLFSQSFAASLTGSKVFSNDVGTERLMSVMQPFFNPGILYNTIKSGLAVDWMTFTGSDSPSYNTAGAAFIQAGSLSGAIRLPFESIVDPGAFLPLATTGSATSASLYYLDTTKWGGTPAGNAGASRGNISDIFGAWTGNQKLNYTLAMHNFLGESSRFFLQGGKYKNILSSPANKMKPFVSGVTYYMDLLCYKTDNMIMYEGPQKITGSTYGVNPETPGFAVEASARGIHYGPMVSIDTDSTLDEFGNFRFDPATAPYTPPYFYGTSVSTFAFRPHEASYLAPGEIQEFKLEEVLGYIKDQGTVHYNKFEHDDSDILVNSLNNTAPFERGTAADTFNFACFAGKEQMNNAASFNLFDLVELPSVDFNPLTGQPLSTNTNTNKFWSISPKFECPVLNFNGTGSTAAGVFPDAFKGVDYNTRGMWRGYGETPADGTGIYFEVKESFPSYTYAAQGSSLRKTLAGKPFNLPTTASLLQHLGFKSGLKRRLGEISETREIFEAVVAIPFKTIGDKKVFFPIVPADDPVTKQVLSRRVVEAILGNDDPLSADVYTPGTSILNMVETMQKYVFPPTLDFITNKSVTPFCMYIFEFNHKLDMQDLADIWQGVMPKISLTAEQQTATITHFLANNELLVGNPITQDLRWMVFKVKQKAEKSYYNVTISTSDDDKFKFNFNIGESTSGVTVPKYSYNWPYDYCSLVELAKIDAAIQIGGDLPVTPPDITPAAGDPLPLGAVKPPVMGGPSMAIPAGAILESSNTLQQIPGTAGQIPAGLNIMNLGSIAAGQPSPMLGSAASNLLMQGGSSYTQKGIKTSGKNMGQYGSAAKKGDI